MTITTTDTTTEPATLIDLTGVDAVRLLGALRAAAVARATDDVRSILCGVFLDVTADDGVRLVATDSYRLVVASASVEDVQPCSQLIPGDIVTPLLKSATPAKVRRASESVRLAIVVSHDTADRSTVGVTLTLGAESVTWSSPTFGTFPDYRMLTHAEGAGETATDHLAAFNARYLASLADIVRALDADAADLPVRLLGLDSRKASAWELAGARSFGVDVRFLLMPVACS